MQHSISMDEVRRAQKGDTAAQQVIIDRFSRPIRSLVARHLRMKWPSHAPYGTPYDVEDHVQDIFLKVFARIGSFDPSRDVKFSTWLYAVVRHHCYDQLRRKRLPAFSMYAASFGDDRQEEWLEGGEPPERIVLRREFTRALLRALAKLPEDLRRTFKLREFEGFEFGKIAGMLRLPLGTVKAQHYRAVDRLRYLLRSFRPSPRPAW